MDFDISLEKTSITAGDKLKGILYIKSKKFDFSKFTFEIAGEEKTSIRIQKSRPHSRHGSKRYTKTYTESDIFYFENILQCLNQSEVNAFQANKVNNKQFAFEFATNSTLLPSYTGKNASIQYTITGKIKKLSLRKTKKEIPIFVSNKNHKKSQLTSKLHDTKRSFANITVQKTNHLPGDIIEGQIDLIKDVGKIKNVELILRGIEYAKANSHSRVLENQKYTNKLKISNDGKSKFKFTIPSDAKSSYAGTYSSYSWELEAKHNRRLRRDYNDYVPLVIG